MSVPRSDMTAATARLELDGVLVLGAGLAGLSAARAAAPRRALVISPEPVGQGCASAWAQGGMAVALSPDDSPAEHARDTVAAGAGLVDAEAALALTTAGPEAVRGLADLGAPFDRDSGGAFLQSLEAAHSKARVARVGGDGAGRAILDALAAATLSLPSVELWAPARARALLQDASGRVRGALIERDGVLIEVIASAVVLATGGAGGLYAVTTDPPAVRGEGLGLAALAGAEIGDPEFVQFHPTALDLGLDPAPLATEALRGEGAMLVDAKGRRFMDAYDPRGELAPRDVVARAIHAERQAGRAVFLDAVQAVGAHFPEHFPAVFAACMAGGVDPRVQAMPVAPAVHYHMGGVRAGMDGRTSLPGLFAAGEVASTGVHGANRLASNSLLEAAVCGARAGVAAAAERDPATAPLAAKPAPDLPHEALQTLRRAMARDAGVVRDAAGLVRLLGVIDVLEAAHGVAPTLVAARLIAAAALQRRESRGAHFRSDYPKTAAVSRHSLLTLAQARAVRAAHPLEAAA
jgi:L-aspartate oxidase